MSFDIDDKREHESCNASSSVHQTAGRTNMCMCIYTHMTWTARCSFFLPWQRKKEKEWRKTLFSLLLSIVHAASHSFFLAVAWVLHAMYDCRSDRAHSSNRQAAGHCAFCIYIWLRRTLHTVYSGILNTNTIEYVCTPNRSKRMLPSETVQIVYNSTGRIHKFQEREKKYKYRFQKIKRNKNTLQRVRGRPERAQHLPAVTRRFIMLLLFSIFQVYM